MRVLKIVKPLSIHVLEVLYMINYNKQITTLQDTLLANDVKKRRERNSVSQ